MVLATSLFAVNNTMVPVLARTLSPVQIFVLANLFGAMLAAPWMGASLFARPRAPAMLLALMASTGISNLLWFEALARANVNLATALSFAAPLAAMPVAALIQGEKITPARWAAVLWGFLGTLVVLRPWRADLGPGLWHTMAATFGFVFVYLLVRLLAGREPPARVVVAMAVSQVLTGLPLLPAVWQPMSWQLTLAVALLATMMQGGRLAMQRAYALGRASVVMPMDFLRLPTIAIVAWIWIGQVPDVWTFAGAAMIVSATVMLARR